MRTKQLQDSYRAEYVAREDTGGIRGDYMRDDASDEEDRGPEAPTQVETDAEKAASPEEKAEQFSAIRAKTDSMQKQVEDSLGLPAGDTSGMAHDVQGDQVLQWDTVTGIPSPRNSKKPSLQHQEKPALTQHAVAAAERAAQVHGLDQSEAERRTSQIDCLFARFDEDSNHCIEFEEFWRLAGLFQGEDFTKEEARRVFGRMDKDQDGKVDQKEFMDFIFKKTKQLKPAGFDKLMSKMLQMVDVMKIVEQKRAAHASDKSLDEGSPPSSPELTGKKNAKKKKKKK